MSIDGGAQIGVLSRDHKPEDELEKIRIQAAGLSHLLEGETSAMALARCKTPNPGVFFVHKKRSLIRKVTDTRVANESGGFSSSVTESSQPAFLATSSSLVNADVLNSASDDFIPKVAGDDACTITVLFAHTGERYRTFNSAVARCTETSPREWRKAREEHTLTPGGCGK